MNDKKKAKQLKLAKEAVAELFREQERYFVLSNLTGGYRYCRMGTSDISGLLMFENAEGASDFCDKVIFPVADEDGDIRPVISSVRAADVYQEVSEAGGACRIVPRPDSGYRMSVVEMNK